MFEINGPWEAVGSLVRAHYNGHGGFLVADCHTGTAFTSEQCCANARLIAAAPDLLAVIRYAIDNPDFKSDVFDQMARAAIAKATGVSP